MTPPSAASNSNAAVPRRPLGDLYSNPRLPSTVPIVGLGCSSFSTFFWTPTEQEELGCFDEWTAESLNRHHPKVQEWIDTIRYAILECGITLLDTAPWYGHGTSEVVLGWALPDLVRDNDDDDDDDDDDRGDGTTADTSMATKAKKRTVRRRDLMINTKVGRYSADPQHQFDYSFDATIQSVDRSLLRMNLTYIDVLQLHDPEFSPNLEILLEQTIPAMIQCQQQGKCKALGMTGYPLHVQYLILQRTLDFIPKDKSPGMMIWDQALTYGHFNLHDTSLFSRPLSPLTTTTAATSFTTLAQYCHQHGLALLAAAPLSLGLLTPQGPPIWHPASESLKRACRDATELVLQQQQQQHQEVNIATLALVVALAHPNISCTILGMKNVHEVQLAAAAANRFHHVTYNDTQKGKESDENNFASNKSNSNYHNDLDLSFLPHILAQVLTKEEFQVWKLLQDPEHGPFAQVWTTGDFQWDGIQIAKEFWTQVDGVEYQDWAKK